MEIEKRNYGSDGDGEDDCDNDIGYNDVTGAGDDDCDNGKDER